jgi:hypothetical protein
MRRWAMIAGVLLVLALAGSVVYVQVMKWHAKALDASLEQRQEAWQRESERLEREIAGLREELALREEAPLPTEKLEEVFGEGAEGMMPEQGEADCEALDGRVRDFFAYLDEKDYIKPYRLEEGTLRAFQNMVGKLSTHPPEVSAELRDPFVLMQNVAHLYRVLGKRGLLMAREVILNESEIVEPVGRLLFEWSSSGGRCREGLEGRPSLTTLYEYSGFFLNSVGGRSYLMRRDSRVRIVTTYYSVLILDLANQAEINRHGIDIRPHIDSLAGEVRYQRGLVYQAEYLDTLEGLREKYASR